MYNYYNQYFTIIIIRNNGTFPVIIYFSSSISTSCIDIIFYDNLSYLEVIILTLYSPSCFLHALFFFSCKGNKSSDQIMLFCRCYVGLNFALICVLLSLLCSTPHEHLRGNVLIYSVSEMLVFRTLICFKFCFS